MYHFLDDGGHKTTSKGSMLHPSCLVCFFIIINQPPCPFPSPPLRPSGPNCSPSPALYPIIAKSFPDQINRSELRTETENITGNEDNPRFPGHFFLVFAFPICLLLRSCYDP